MNSPDHERFERAYRRVWGALHRGDEPGLSQHERQLLHHVPAAGGVALTDLARHLALPKSTASVVVKDLERRGFVRRRRDARDERRLAIVLTAEGRRRVAADTVLEPRAAGAGARRARQPAGGRSCSTRSRRLRTRPSGCRNVWVLPMLLPLVLLFIVVPIAELFVIIQVGQAIGVWWTIAILIADSILGSMLMRSQGRTAWRRFNDTRRPAASRRARCSTACS